MDHSTLQKKVTLDLPSASNSMKMNLKVTPLNGKLPMDCSVELPNSDTNCNVPNFIDVGNNSPITSNAGVELD